MTTVPSAALAIICKAPRAGESKTRLIPSLGPDRAAALSRAFLRDLAVTILDTAERIGGHGYAVCSPASAVDELASVLPSSFGFLVETHPVLGEVLDAATGALLARGHDCVVLINGDSPTLPSRLLCHAVASLREPGERVVFGPALDGGYTLVGLQRREPRLFADIPWSTPTVLASSLARAREIGLPAVLTERWYDVDDLVSLGWLRSELGGRLPMDLTGVGARADATRAVLADDR